MSRAVEQELAATPEGNGGLDVAGDGSWRRRGFTSLQGISHLTGIRTGKVVDVSIKNKYCQGCKEWEGKEDSGEYEEWFEKHKLTCSANHEGSSGKMEVDGVVEMFQNSEKKYKVRYKNYVGDGDCKVFHNLSELKPYGDDFVINKRECVGHVQKRMGTRLRALKKRLAKEKLSDGKTIGGRGRLTGKVIDQLTVYYGKAIRDHSDSAENMRNAIWAAYYHRKSTDEDPQHQYCPEGNDSWCRWQRAKFAGTERAYKHRNSIPAAVMDVMKDIYEDLSNPELLQRCIGGFTQNANESFNNSVWKLVPKTSFSGKTVLEIGVYTAVSCFNDGRVGFLKIMSECEIQPGEAALQWAKTSDDARLFHSVRYAEESTKEARRAKRLAQNESTDDSYAPGGH